MKSTPTTPTSKIAALTQLLQRNVGENMVANSEARNRHVHIACIFFAFFSLSPSGNLTQARKHFSTDLSRARLGI